jgi:hypothetical protein
MTIIDSYPPELERMAELTAIRSNADPIDYGSGGI